MTLPAALLALASLTGGPAVPLSEDELATYPDARGMPADVQHFMVRWSDCVHWLGEPAWDEDRQREIDRAVAEVCPGIDAERAHVLRRHADRPAVTGRLETYETLNQ